MTILYVYPQQYEDTELLPDPGDVDRKPHQMKDLTLKPGNVSLA
jgi:hypothetical protein